MSKDILKSKQDFVFIGGLKDACCNNGWWKNGAELASLLIADGHDVTLLESNEKLCNIASSELDAMVI